MEEKKENIDELMKVRNALFMGDRVLLEPMSQDRVSQAGIIMQGNTQADQFLFGKVIWVGPGTEYCRIGHHVKYKKAHATPIIIENEHYVMGKECVMIEIITDYFKDGGSLSSLITHEQAKKLAGHAVNAMSNLATDIANLIEEKLNRQKEKDSKE